ncbi:DUF6233 domain-containing protein [Streptomyces scopuliridis]|uniref:DUF6233 domain-containing protein n=1 Tax=Streptomyces scopuliridis TaxID=452529 RepID=UPI0036AA62B4
MFDLPPDLPRLRTLETYVRLQLHLIAEAIAIAEQREAAEQEAARQRKQRRPPPPDWTVSRGIDAHRSPVAVHIGGCHMQGKHVQAASRDDAVRLLSDGVEACGHCRPDTALGVLD